ncbi:hypothetical protein C3E78_07685 [Aeromicrobium chenweiae]|uniref:Uncharacterized protein n=1 Tax=Aeromicrobium chenweiae TaxID=2079793 RepID=A0A2S0WL63_9ACTN|nr:hypothetical protein C3E78_07685 [Aeromicrobium chenweiae]
MALGLAAGLAAAVPSSANAASGKQKYVKVSTKYVHNWTFRSKAIKACVFFEVSGKITGTRRYAYHNPEGDGWDTNWYYYYKIKANNPKIKAKAWPRKGSGCDSTKKVKLTKLQLKQAWNETRCGLGLSYTGSIPFAISVNSTPGCKKHSLGTLSTSHSGPITGASQSNSGSAIKFKSGVIARKGDAIGFKAAARVTGHRKIKGVGKSDSVSKSFYAYLK